MEPSLVSAEATGAGCESSVEANCAVSAQDVNMKVFSRGLTSR